MPISASPLDPVPDRPSKILNILSFFCPPVGLIVYLSLVGRMPRQALAAGLSAAKGVATMLSLLLLMGTVSFAMWLADDVFNLFQAPADTEDTTVTTKPPTPPR